MTFSRDEQRESNVPPETQRQGARKSPESHRSATLDGRAADWPHCRLEALPQSWGAFCRLDGEDGG